MACHRTSRGAARSGFGTDPGGRWRLPFCCMPVAMAVAAAAAEAAVCACAVRLRLTQHRTIQHEMVRRAGAGQGLGARQGDPQILTRIHQPSNPFPCVARGVTAWTGPPTQHLGVQVPPCTRRRVCYQSSSGIRKGTSRCVGVQEAHMVCPVPSPPLHNCLAAASHGPSCMQQCCVSNKTEQWIGPPQSKHDWTQASWDGALMMSLLGNENPKVSASRNMQV